MKHLARTAYTSLLIALLFLTQSYAQSLSIEAYGGIVTGSPLGEVPEGATGAPGVGPYVGLTTTYQFNPRLALRTGALYAHKGSEYDAPIIGRTKVNRRILGINIEFPFNLKYEGRAQGAYSNHYIAIPAVLIYRTKGRFSFTAGGYAAHLLKGSHEGSVDVRVANLFNVNDEPFDATPSLATWDFGAIAGTEFRIMDRLYADFSANVGLISVNSENPEGLEGIYRNIYVAFGLHYKLFNFSW